MLTGRRTVLVTADEVVLRAEPSEVAAPVARAEQGVVARLRACRPDWCEIDAAGHEGWVPKSGIWGVEPGEIVED
jgi:SH3-like domain-containing protein